MYKISIDDSVLDFIGDPRIILMTNDPLDYSFGKAHKTYYVELLDTGNNRRILGNSTKLDASLQIDDIVYQGLLYIDKDENGIKYGQFVSGSGKVWDDLKGVKLNEIDFSEHNHTLNKTNVDTYDVTVRPFTSYDLSDRGVKLKSKEQGDTPDDWLTYFRYWDIIERFPAFNVRKMLEKIFEQYELIDNLPDWFADLYLLYTGTHEPRNDSDWMRDSEFTSTTSGYTMTKNIATATFNFELSSAIYGWDPVINDGGHIDGVSYDVWTVPEKGTYRIDGLIELEINKTDAVAGTFTSVASGVAKMSVSRERDTVEDDLIYYSENFTIATAADSATAVRYLDTRYLELEEGDLIYMKHHVTGITKTTDPGALPSQVRVDLGVNSTFNITPNRWYGVGSEMVISDLMPETEVMTFIKELCKFLNINIYYKNTTRQIYLWQYSPTKITDWTTRVLWDKDMVREYEQPRKYIFKFKEDADQSLTEPREYTMDVDGDEADFEVGFSDYKDLTFAEDYLGIPQILTGKKRDESNRVFSFYDFKTEANARLGIRERLTPYQYRGFNEYYLLAANPGGTAGSIQTTKTTYPGMFNDELQLEDIYNEHHRKTIQSINEGEVLSCTLLLTASDIREFINLKETTKVIGTTAAGDPINDWYLPAINEIEIFSDNIGFATTPIAHIWSSTELNVGGDIEAYYWDLSIGATGSRADKSWPMPFMIGRQFFSAVAKATGTVWEDEGVVIYKKENHISGTGWLYWGSALYDQYTYGNLATPPGENGDILIASQSIWSNVGTEVGASAQDVDLGSGNTAAIIAQAGHATSAAKICTDYVVQLSPAVDLTTQIQHDWRAAYHIDGKNYRLIELEQLEGDIYRGKFIQIFI